MGKYQARVAADVILGKDVARPGQHGRRPARSPSPTLRSCAVGLTEAQARERGLDVAGRARTAPATSPALLRGRGHRRDGQLVVDEARGVIVGATFTGPGVQELLHAATIAIAGEVPLDTLWHAVPAFPTVSEVWLRLLEAYGL